MSYYKPWQLAPDSDPEQRWIVVCGENDETEVVGIVETEERARQIADVLNSIRERLAECEQLANDYKSCDTRDYDSSVEACDAILASLGQSDVIRVLKAEKESIVLQALRRGAIDRLWANKVMEKLKLADKLARRILDRKEGES